MNASKTVYVVDDDADMCKSISAVIEAMGVEIQTCSSAAEFLELYDGRHPACLVLDVRMPGMSGLELQDELIRRDLTLPVILISGHGDVPMAVDAVKKGAIDFLEKPFRNQVLWDNVSKALAIDTDNQGKRETKAALDEKLSHLTVKERNVMALVVEGKASKEIAAVLGVSPKTVESHRTHIFEKMGVKSAVQLTRLVIRAELI